GSVHRRGRGDVRRGRSMWGVVAQRKRGRGWQTFARRRRRAMTGRRRTRRGDVCRPRDGSRWIVERRLEGGLGGILGVGKTAAGFQIEHWAPPRGRWAMTPSF